MTQEDKDYLEQAKLWIDSCDNIGREMDLEIKFSLQVIAIRQEAIEIAQKRKQLNERQIRQFKRKIIDYCGVERIEVPEWAIIKS